MATFKKPSCNCPDSTQNQNKNLFATSQSATFDRNWLSRIDSQGNTITFPGISASGGYCKHEMATLIIRKNLKDAFPNGVPYKPRIE